MPRHIAASHVQATRQMWHGKALIHRNNVCDAIAAVDDNARLQPLRIQCEDGLDRYVYAIETVLFKHDAAHFLAVLFRVHRRLG